MAGPGDDLVFSPPSMISCKIQSPTRKALVSVEASEFKIKPNCSFLLDQVDHTSQVHNAAANVVHWVIGSTGHSAV
jgi:hypothetical protein